MCPLIDIALYININSKCYALIKPIQKFLEPVLKLERWSLPLYLVTHISLEIAEMKLLISEHYLRNSSDRRAEPHAIKAQHLLFMFI